MVHCTTPLARGARASSRAALAALVAVALTLVAGVVEAQEPIPPPATPDTPARVEPPTPKPAAQGTDCEWGCLRWSKQCNVDPRGVYRCQRMCTQMGEVCQ